MGTPIEIHGAGSGAGGGLSKAEVEKLVKELADPTAVMNTHLEAKDPHGDRAALGGVRHTILSASGRYTSAAVPVAGVKFWIGGNINSVTPAAAATMPIILRLRAADLAVSGLTPKLRVDGSMFVTTSKENEVSIGLYPVEYAASAQKLGAVIAGSTVALKTEEGKRLKGLSTEFDLPADGDYALGLTLSLLPVTDMVADGILQVRWV